jgi:hypothetical protein
MRKESDQLIAAEEVLSELAQIHPKSGLVQGHRRDPQGVQEQAGPDGA